MSDEDLSSTSASTDTGHDKGANETQPDVAAHTRGPTPGAPTASEPNPAPMDTLLHFPGRVLNEIEKHLLPAWRRRTSDEPRWAVSIAVCVAIALQLTLPQSLEMPPRWLLPSVGVALLAGIVIANPRVSNRRSRRFRASGIVLTGVLSLANATSAGRLIVALTNGTATKDAAMLLQWGGAIWLTNVIVFAMWYWELDRGGPASRSDGERPYPDLLFTQMTTPGVAPPDWEPEFLDYFYLAFTNATAFSPTDVLPLSRWAKMLMLMQSAVSVSTLVLVVARAVNILQ